MNNNKNEIAVGQQSGFCANDAKSNHGRRNDRFNGKTTGVDVTGIGTGDDGEGEAANDATGLNDGETSNVVSSQAPNGDERGRDGAGAIEGGNNDADKDGSEATMLSPPTICLGGDCQRYWDDC